ncbi:MAG TPA: SIMPL domain-containing protein, partial [Luteimonas sp.]|nr:SIMPL domain-containing protein [Luteimonas sp.]
YMREIEVRFHTLDRLREFIAALPEDKALRIDTKKFETSRAAEIKRGLLQKAISDARLTAGALAAGVGRKLGPVHTISNQSLNIRYSESTQLGSVTVSGAIALMAPGVAAMREGRITLDQDVYIIYALE